jgi:3'-phosphoadenosine 5'-phosphosulfate sulfotransferase (PAPS reductase)/FAD synthetase
VGDVEVNPWDPWNEMYLAWAETSQHERMVARASKAITEAHARGEVERLSWSSGKDSTVMVHMANVEMGLGIDVVHVRDDTSFPGQDEYIDRLTSRWGLRLDIVDNPTSLLHLAREALDRGDDVFERRDHTVPGTGFFDAITTYYDRCGVTMVYLGYRGDESRGRAFRRSRGETYRRGDGITTCCPLVRWSACDVYAYLLSRRVPLHPYYTRLLPGEDPGTVRVDGWLPHCPAWTGSAVRLRRLWPELWQEAIGVFPELAELA